MTDTTAAPQSTQKLDGNLTGRVAFVTGGTRGIGAAISRTLADQGAGIAVGYAGNVAAAEAFADEFRSRHADDGVKCTLHQGNIGSGDYCRRAIAEVIAEHGRLDILVNNAGITIDKTVAKMTDDDWEKVLSTNLSSAFYLSQAALAHMLERGTGRIINISSTVGEMGHIGQVNYAASKSGLFGLTKSLALEVLFQLGRSGKLTDNNIGVTVNVVSPGYVETDMFAAIPEKIVERILTEIPMRRPCQPEEVARLVHFLASDTAGYVTGQVWAINGGLHM